MSSAPRIGVVLSSGGVRGVYAHTGFLRALEQLDIAYEALAGCSAGAIVGGIVASGTPLEDWSRVIAGARTRTFWRPDPLWRILWELVVRHGVGYTGFAGTEAAIAFCEDHLAVRRFEECRRPFRALALSLGRNRKVVFARGELAPRMVASAAIPVLYRPVEIEGDWYCDGAVVDFSPVDAICCAHNLDLVLLHHVAVHRASPGQLQHSLRAPWSMVRVLDRIIYRQHPWYLTGDPLSRHLCPGGCNTPIVVLEPTMPDLPWSATEGGVAVEKAVAEQTVAALQSYARLTRADVGRLTPEKPGGVLEEGEKRGGSR